ncbi:MAG: error-prone DNA polymerase [Flavisolibacter sp.]
MYTELQITSNFSFLRGASHPDELAEQAAMLGYNALAITDRNTMAGIVRAHVAAKAAGIRLIPGCRIDLQDGPSLLAYPTNKNGYEKICALLTLGNLRTEKGKCLLYREDVFQHRVDSKFIVIPPAKLNANFSFDHEFVSALQCYADVFQEELYLAASYSYCGDDAKKIFRLSQLSQSLDIPLIATNDVHYHHPARRELQDILTCIREKCTIHNAGYRLHQNAERHFKTKEEMQRLFRAYPDALRRTQELAEACRFSLDSLQYVYPEEITTGGRSPMEELTLLTWQGAEDQFGESIPKKIKDTIQHELRFINEMNYAAYFLTVYDIVKYARSRHILCQGRGSAANSTVCFCLGITSVNPAKFDLLFERFISAARNEPPDIDVDFEHERREEVIQYIYNKYGRGRAAIVATVTQQQQRGAIRDVGKAMGLSPDALDRLSGSIWELSGGTFNQKYLTEQGFSLKDPHTNKLLQLTREYLGFPRQLGQHTGGFVISQHKLSNLCPVLNARMKDRTNIEWNKDDIDALGFLKIDVLALGMLTCIRKAFDLARQHYGLDLTLSNIAPDDPKVYEMIDHADTVGVFQIESRAQQSMLPRLKPKNFYDLVVEVAIVRPGPIQGDMVHPYLRRRNGEEPITYPSKELEEILGRTLGVPLFQEQAMKIAIVAAGFTPAEADQLRRSMATFRANGMVGKFRDKLTQGMLKNGYTEEYAARIFKQLEGFGSYGFPEAHAASFAHLVYVSAWIKCYYPDVFLTALLNSLPMGFYQPAQLVIDAREHGVEVLPVDVNASGWDHLIASPGVVRLGFRQVKGAREEEMRVFENRRNQTFTSIDQLLHAGLSSATLERLADADAFRSLGLDRRQALAQVYALLDHPVGLFENQPSETAQEGELPLPSMTMGEHVVQDYLSTTLSVKAHPMSFAREKLQRLQALTTRELSQRKDKATVKVAGIPFVRQRPGTASGVCFISIEDETGKANLVVFPQIFEKYRKEIMQSRLLLVEGKLQVEGELIHVIVSRCYNVSGFLDEMSKPEELIKPAAKKDTTATSKKPTAVQQEIFATARNFR